jgi:hypothetical protein
VELRGLSLTNDAFDTAKVGLSGTGDVSSLLNLQDKTLPFVYMMMATHQGGLRTVYHEQLPVTVEPSIRLAAKLMDMPWSAPLSSRGVLIDHFVLHCPRYLWTTYFLGGDESWHEEEVRLAQSLKAWEKTYSILKKTLCPPTSSF